MKPLSIASSIIACTATIHSALAQGPIENCTYTTATSCVPFTPPGPTETITVYEVPFVATFTQTFDCQGCEDVTVITTGTDCIGVPPPITATTFVVEPESTTTVDVCSVTPN